MFLLCSAIAATTDIYQETLILSVNGFVNVAQIYVQYCWNSKAEVFPGKNFSPSTVMYNYLNLHLGNSTVTKGFFLASIILLSLADSVIAVLQMIVNMSILTYSVSSILDTSIIV